MSMHFAPQWVKPIKPTGSALAPASDTLLAQVPKQPTAPVSPFPALGQPRAGSPTTAASSNPPLSYSRVTHAPASPSFSGEDYFPHAGDGANGGANPSPYPFRYSREQILGIWDEDKFKERPIELMQMAETDNGQVLVSKAIVQPVGLRELSEVEKRILSTSVHPPVVSRRQPQAHTGTSHGNNPGEAALPRRVPQPAMKETTNVNTAPSRGTAFGGFGRGEGGAFGGSKYTSGALGEGRQPGAIGGGFGGVGKRTTRREEDPTRPSPASAAPSWRSVRNQSGTFEGVLGFGNSSVAPTIDPAPANGRQDSDRGWGAAEKQWRAAPNDERPLSIPTTEPSTQSVIATASATPVGERDAQLRENTPGPRSGTQTPQAQETQDLGNVNWYYRDPNGQEQGPFTGTQMHEWFSHSYFQDELPVRRENETSFHKLSELKANTNTAVQPFLAPVRPRLPPNLPIPVSALQAPGPAAGSAPSTGGLNDTFGRLNMGNLPAPQPQYHPNAYQGGQFGQQAQSNNQFASAPFGSQQWNPAPGTQSPARVNGAYGSIGPQPAYSPYGGPIGTPPIQRPEVFASPIGQPSPWSAATANPAIHWQQQPVQQQLPPVPIAHQPQQQFIQQQPTIPQQHAAAEPSYFPPTEDILPEQTAPTEEYDDAHDETMVEDYLDSDHEFEDDLSQADVEEEEEDIVEEQPGEKEELAPKPAPASVWAKTPKSTSRKAANEPTPAQASKLPPPHASLPPKPTAAPIMSDAIKEPSPPPALAMPAERSTPKAAPWATADKQAHGPSLREIQEAEARQSAARRQARVEARAASQATIVTSNEDLPASMTWGLPSSKGSVPPPSSSTPPTPAWGGGSEGPKKTLKQIQEEEERRNLKLARQQQSVVAAATPTTKRGYADLAATHAPTPAQAAAAAAAGWTTVGAGGKNAATPVKPAPLPPKPVTTVKPVAAVAKPAAKVPVADEQPSIEFIRWTKQALTGLSVPVDDFISMLLTFPVDPPASSRGEQQEIIADSVYASSSTLDGRRFAQEFMTRRKADAKRDTSKPAAKIGSLADVVKTQSKAPAADVGFKVVKAKKKRS
ncbi:hypothetical protein CspHIS471_0504490 [Cutaneotrichosporon sp. HIS471]|nr:hypothetical protein CspHIS471_0504490 [Cutaneotrichosporon sp. HIS471]